MPSAQLEQVTKNLNSVSKFWAFAGELATIGHLSSLGLLSPNKVKFKEIQVVVPKSKIGLFHFALLSKGYKMNLNRSSNTIKIFRHKFQKRPLILYVRSVMPKIVSYKNGERFVNVFNMPNSKAGNRTRNFVRTIQRLQNNVN